MDTSFKLLIAKACSLRGHAVGSDPCHHPAVRVQSVLVVILSADRPGCDALADICDLVHRDEVHDVWEIGASLLKAE
jgi:hypothetical protein